MSYHARDIDSAWNKVGMVIKESKDRRALLYHEGHLVLTTKRPQGSGPLEGRIPDFIRQQMRLSDVQFRDLVNCPLGRIGYLEILRLKGYLPQSKK